MSTKTNEVAGWQRTPAAASVQTEETTAARSRTAKKQKQSRSVK